MEVMIGQGISRRRLMEIGGGVAAASLMLSGRAAIGQSGGATAIGQPMPDGVELPETAPQPVRADSVGFAIVGLGGYALNQMMPRFERAERAHIAALVSGNPDKLQRVGDAYGVPAESRYSYDNFEEIASNEGVDAVYIVLPSGLHADWTERAFATGKHVLCEKPMALSSAECERMIAAGQRADRKLMIAYRCHFEPYNLQAMELMKQNAVDKLRLIRTQHSYRMGPTSPSENWRVDRTLAGGGPLEDYGIYGLQAALYLSGEMPESIAAATYQPTADPRFAEIFAHVSSQMRFPSGAVAQLATSYDAAPLNEVDARGSAGALLMQPATNYSGNELVLEVGGERRVFTPGDSTVQFARQLDHLADAIRDGAEIRTPGEMGLRDLRLIEAIYASAGRGSAVMLNPDGTMRG